jgi:hypothetical protein
MGEVPHVPIVYPVCADAEQHASITTIAAKFFRMFSISISNCKPNSILQRESFYVATSFPSFLTACIG